MANKKNHNKEIKKGLYLIPTPIGNLGDITFRAVEILKNSDCILCEDTRISRNLLDKFDIKSKLISNHKFNEKKNLSYVIDLLKQFELTVEEHKKIAEYCSKKDILYMCTAWDNKSIKVLESFDVSAYKVASADLTNMPLLEELSSTKKPLILSTGMSKESEIKKTVNFLNSKKISFALLHCNSTYPAPLHDINLKWMTKLKKIHPITGYSGHERGINVSIGAVALGACIVERHYTLDRNMEGSDHSASVTPWGLFKLVSGIKELESAYGNGKIEVTETELPVRKI